jgi:hypothetical protein
LTFAERAFQGFDFTARLAYLDITAALGASFDYAFEILEILSKVNESPTPPALCFRQDKRMISATKDNNDVQLQ